MNAGGLIFLLVLAAVIFVAFKKLAEDKKKQDAKNRERELLDKFAREKHELDKLYEIEKKGEIERIKKESWASLNRIVSENKEILSRKLHQSLYKDSYGNYKTEAWVKEIDYFIEYVVKCSPDGAKAYGLLSRFSSERVHGKLSDLIHAAASSIAMRDEFDISDVESGVEYERYCAALLDGAGWDVELTKGSGDQGIDLIAVKGRLSIVVQCKFYSQPVGNAAVQEIIAGREFQKAEYAIVVSNNEYTRAARQLAQAAKVYLIHHSSLPNLDSILNAQ